jgi:hypothetical protein
LLKRKKLAFDRVRRAALGYHSDADWTARKYGTRCGAFAISGKSWSQVHREGAERATEAALDECGKTGKSCRMIDAVRANGTGRLVKTNE